MIIAVSTERTIGLVILAIIGVAWIAYVFVNILQSKAEIGSEIELAANRRELPSDEEFEGPRLERVQAWGVLFLAVIGLGLPIYWLREPGRQDGAQRLLDDQALSRGETAYTEGFGCQDCHGADLSGGAAPTIINVPRGSTGETVAVAVNWAAPSLNDIFSRFDTDIEHPSESTEVRAILDFGRAPVMPAWGLPGGGPGNEQQIQDVIDYLWFNQLDDLEVAAKWQDAFETQKGLEANAGKSDGQILYELHCSRCHTPQWSSRGEHAQPTGVTVEVEPGQNGAGAYGEAHSTSSLTQQFPDVASMVDFVSRGSDQNVPYGTRGLGDYGMPGFGRFLTDEEITLISEYARSLNQDPDAIGNAGDEVAVEDGE